MVTSAVQESAGRRPIRVLLAKIGLDGHDRGVKLLARAFRDQGIDVIYTGLWQTASATVHAAMQEDVDIIGVSLLSAAHMTIMPEVMRWRTKLGVEHIPVVLGGIVPEEDLAAIKAIGVSEVFNPGSSMERIVACLQRLAAERVHPDPADLLRLYKQGGVAALGQLLTHCQDHGIDPSWQLPERKAQIIGVTGSPGVGKSSLIRRLAGLLRQQGKRVAVVAVDPSSPISGGALLGDRLRMMSPEPDEGFFVRSLSSGNVQGGLGPYCEEVVRVVAGFGFDFVLVETVGAGQADVSIRTLADKTLLLLMPGAGDEVQFSKAGIIEIASGFVLNKADLPGADLTHAHLTTAVGADRPIWRVSTLKNEGIDKVAEWLMAE